MATARLLAQLIRQGFPEATAKKILSGELPMDQASRMARAKEQGYDLDTDWVHVNRGGIVGEGFDDARLPSRDPDAPFNAHWLTTKPTPSTAYRGGRDGDTYTPVYLSKEGHGQYRDARPDMDANPYLGGSDMREALKNEGHRSLLFEGRDPIDAAELAEKGKTTFRNARGRKSTLKNDVYRFGGEEYPTVDLYEGGEHITGYEDLPDFEGAAPEKGTVAVLDPSAIRSRYAAFDPDNAGKNTMMGSARPDMLAATASGTAGATGLMAKLIKDSQDDSTVRAPKNPKTAMLATLLRDGERAVEGSPAEFVYPSGLAPWLERLAYDEKPSKLETAMAIADFM
tara:strand:+ start:85 stop:1107 length:1023 start_codon:yes stop_codon:yes gene_type:complete